MVEQSDLVINFTILLGLALVGGMVAHRLRQPVILGYLIVGLITGPHAFALVNDPVIVEAGATIGVALLMFTLGLEVSFSQLKQVGKVGLWGGIAQICITFSLGLVLARFLFNWAFPSAVIFGLIISLSSTMVCLKILMERGELDSLHGRIMIAMLILQDISVVLMIIALPIIEGAEHSLALSLALAVGKVALFIGIAIVLGIWVLPWLMGRVGGIRSRELFLLTVLVLSLGAAVSTELFGLSAVFGAFLVGLVLRETRFAHQALAEITPLRDSFAALFFVSLGMLLDPNLVAEHWVSVLLTVVIIILIKFLTVFGIVRIFRYSTGLSMLVGAGLFQIGEFSFILAQDGLNTGILSSTMYSIIIGSAIITMLLTPVSISLASRFYSSHLGMLKRDRMAMEQIESEKISKPVVIAGMGRIGQNVAKSLDNVNIPYRVIEIDPEIVFSMRCEGAACIYGDATNMNVLHQVELAHADIFVVTFPDPLAVLKTVRGALMINPHLKIIARVHREREAEILKRMGLTELVSPEYEASLEFVRRILVVSGLEDENVERKLSEISEDSEIIEFSNDEKV